MVLGIIVTAVADHAVLLEPDARSAWPVGLLCAGTALYLLGNALFRRATGGPWLPSHLVGVAALVGLYFLNPVLPSLAISWLANAVLFAVVLVDAVSLRCRCGAGQRDRAARLRMTRSLTTISRMPHTVIATSANGRVGNP